ncbi:hypothetical protein PR048_020690 [Dryococelus australis]|uniref:Uncharacterized protein n=1 Tax=Dryococelus australis TaxID=614101 RepID=A0ABQ9H6Z5_9NEOP|nr:hypothetical protein PR048_020690 [Dryococelus australis]
MRKSGVTRPGIEPGSPCEGSMLTAQPPWLPTVSVLREDDAVLTGGGGGEEDRKWRLSGKLVSWPQAEVVDLTACLPRFLPEDPPSAFIVQRPLPCVHAVRLEHCSPLQSLELSGDGALDVRGNVILIVPVPLDLTRRGKLQIRCHGSCPAHLHNDRGQRLCVMGQVSSALAQLATAGCPVPQLDHSVSVAIVWCYRESDSETSSYWLGELVRTRTPGARCCDRTLGEESPAGVLFTCQCEEKCSSLGGGRLTAESLVEVGVTQFLSRGPHVQICAPGLRRCDSSKGYALAFIKLWRAGGGTPGGGGRGVGAISWPREN